MSFENDGNWLKNEYENIKEEEKVRLEERGMKDLLRLVKGDNPVVLNLKEAPKDVNTKYGLRKVLTLIEPSDKALMLTPWIYKMLISWVVENGNNSRVTIIKTGEGKETRYEFK